MMRGCERYSTRLRRIVELGGAVLLRGQHIHPSAAQAFGDRAREVDVRVEADAHGSRPASRNRFFTGESPAAAFIRWTSR